MLSFDGIETTGFVVLIHHNTFSDPTNTDLLRVYVYAQTFVVDTSVEFRYSLLIRARQIIVDYSQSPVVTIDHYGAEFDMYNLTEAIYTGTFGF